MHWPKTVRHFFNFTAFLFFNRRPSTARRLFAIILCEHLKTVNCCLLTFACPPGKISDSSNAVTGKSEFGLFHLNKCPMPGAIPRLLKFKIIDSIA